MTEEVGLSRRRLLIWTAVSAVLSLGSIAGYALMLRVPIPRDPAADSFKDVRTSPLFAGTIDSAKRLVAEVRRARNYPAVSVAAAVDGNLVWVSAVGFADVERRILATPASQFLVGSVSKPVTASLVMRLVASGRMMLDEDIHRYAPAFPQKKFPITVRQLLSHQAGIRHYRFGLLLPGFHESFLNREYPTTADALALFAGDALEFRPDSQFLYSTFGYTLLSAGVEGATGLRFGEALQKEIVGPLQLTGTGLDTENDRPSERTRDYVQAPGTGNVKPARATNSSYKWAGGGIRSTASDLATFGAALLDGRVVPPALTREMFSPRRTANGAINEQGYALGWRAGDSMTQPGDTSKSYPIVHHGGTAAGSEAAILLVPDKRVAVALTANANSGGSGALVQVAARIARLLLRPDSVQRAGR